MDPDIDPELDLDPLVRGMDPGIWIQIRDLDPDLDPHQNVRDPQRWIFFYKFFL